MALCLCTIGKGTVSVHDIGIVSMHEWEGQSVVWVLHIQGLVCNRCMPLLA